MNDPSHTDHERGLLDDLEAEYLELVGRGDHDAYQYALEESRVFNCVVDGNVLAILAAATPEGDSTGLARIVRDALMEALAEHVAPQWAREQYPKRAAEFKDMAAEWAAEAA